MNSFPFSDSHIISKMLSEQGLKPYNCSELEAAYGTFSALLMTCLQCKMHSEVVISGLVVFFFSLLFLSSFAASLIPPHSRFFSPE